MSKKRLNSWENEVSRLAVNQIGRSALSMDADSVIISEELEASVGSCIIKTRHIKQKRLTSKNLAVIFIAAILAILTTFSVAAILNVNSDKYIIKYYDEYFTLRTRPPKNFSVMKDEDFVKKSPSYIPEGYELHQSNSNPCIVVLIYVNQTTGLSFSYEQFKMCQNIRQIDSERSSITYITINGYDAVAVSWNENDIEETILFWTDGVYDYMVSADMPLTETLAIAESIE